MREVLLLFHGLASHSMDGWEELGVNVSAEVKLSGKR